MALLVIRRKTLYLFLVVNVLFVMLVFAYVFVSLFGFDTVLKNKYEEYREQRLCELEYENEEYFNEAKYDQAWQTDEGW